MAELGPNAKAPQQGWFEELYENKLNQDSPMPIRVAYWTFWIGILLLVIGLFTPLGNRGTIITCSILFFILSIAIWLVFIPFIMLYLLNPFNRRRHYSYGGGSSSSGAFAGGSSGGGGATGSW